MRKLRVLGLVMVLILAGLSAVACGGSGGVSEVEYQAIQAQLQTAQKSAADALAQVTQLQQQLTTAQAQVTDLQGQVDSLSSTSGGVDPAAYNALKKQYDDATTQIAALNSQLDGAAADYAALQDQVNSYAAQISDLQQQVSELSAPPGTTPLPMTVDNIKNAVWDRINLERVQGFVSQLQQGKNLQGWADQHVIQMADANKITVYTDAQVGTQAAMMAIGYQSLDELVNATFTYWKISPAWFDDQVLSPAAAYGAVAVLQKGTVFYISFMSSNYP